MRCPFVGDRLEKCKLCGLTRYPPESLNDNHPKCRRRFIFLIKLLYILEKMPPINGAWCPLCSLLVQPTNSKEVWRKHLKIECYNNPRNNRWPQQMNFNE